MLVLSRKLGERILVPGCDLVITVVAIEGNSIRLGITASAEVAVYREEVWNRLHPAHATAAPGGPLPRRTGDACGTAQGGRPPR